MNKITCTDVNETKIKKLDGVLLSNGQQYWRRRVSIAWKNANSMLFHLCCTGSSSLSHLIFYFITNCC